MNGKKLLAALLAAVLCLGLLAACNSSEQPSDSQPPAQESQPAESAAAEDTPAPALDFPKSTITIVNPYSAGGNTDIVARLVADELSKDLGVSVIVDNRTGGSGAVGMLSCATSPADGYTLVICASGAATITPNTSDVGYTADSFVRVAQLIEQPNIFCVSSKLGVNTWEEYLDYVGSNAGTSYGTTGATSLANLQFSVILKEAGIAPVHVPFDGGAAAVTAVLGGHADAVVTVPGEVASYISSGEMVPLLCTTAERDASLPDVPTATEKGYSVNAGVWTGICAPAGVDAQIVDFLSEAISKVLEKENVITAINNCGSSVSYLNAADFDAMLTNEYQSMGQVLEDLGLVQ